MSRAFVSEDSGSDEAEGMYEIPLPLPAGAKNYMTPEGADRMAAELRGLTETERPRAAAALAAAAAGDGAGAIRRLSEIERRISYLARMSSALEVASPPASLDRMVFGLVARVREEGGAEREYRIVGVDESDPDRGLLSWASPVARALVGKRCGDTAIARLPGGVMKLKILGIRGSDS